MTDNQLRIAFQSRGSYRDKMRLRNSRKNDNEIYEKMKNLARQMESLQTILTGVKTRELLKQYTIENKISAFELERAEKLSKKIDPVINESKIVEQSKELRNSIKISDFVQHPVAALPQVQPTQLRLPTELPIKRLRPEVQKKSDLSFDVALICCRLITEGEKLRLWPLIDPKKTEGNNETNHVPSSINPLQNEEKLKMRGRIGRGNKKITIDRLVMNDCEHSWGRYMGLSGNWHNLESELHNEFFDDEDSEAFQRLHKLLIQGCKNFNKFRTH